MIAAMSDDPRALGLRLNARLTEAGLDPLDPPIIRRFEDYLSLILRWNAKMNLTAIRDEEGILSRHFVESIACACALPAGIFTLLDFGSGAGFPGIPIALCRPEIAVILAESQSRKAAFLQEAVRVLEISAKVFARRAESLTEQFDCVVLRAVDRMPKAVHAAVQLVRPGGWLALMTTVGELAVFRFAVGEGFAWRQTIPLTGGEDRVIALAEKRINLQA